MKIIIAICATSLLCGCARPVVVDPAKVVMQPGQGVPGLVELGMSVKELRASLSGVIVVHTPRGRAPWRRRGTDTRLPWEKVEMHFVTIPALGLHFQGFGKDQDISYLAVLVQERPGRDNRYRGAIADGPCFATGSVTRAELMARFGKPSVNLVHTNEGLSHYDTTRLLAPYGPAQSLSIKYGTPVDACEWIRYPADGIEFHLQTNVVDRFVIKRKIEQSDGEATSEPAPGSDASHP